MNISPWRRRETAWIWMAFLAVTGCVDHHPPNRREIRITQNQNRLAGTHSPYLLQHAENPVDWFPWGEEAFARARAEDRPIFLSIGYSACHWCHVMERLSFENDSLAAFLNEHFVCIKVDREEHPEVDDIYMNAVQMMTGSGGWPLSLFLTPDLKPFYGGTYFPPEDRYGRPGFRWVLQQVITAWNARREDVEHSAAQLADALRSLNAPQNDPREFSRELVDSAFQRVGESFDAANGGFGPAPKFPPTGQVELLLRVHHRTGSPEPRAMTEKTLQKMASGGIFDQLGGGFHRYSTDAEWLVPHFEKMLYDNALLAIAYLEGYQVTDDPFYADIARRTLDWVLREMTDPGGGFYSALDADSEGEEGKYYLWSQEEIRSLLGDDDGLLFSQAYGITTGGNFEGRNILHLPLSIAQFAAHKGMTADELNRRLTDSRARLLEVRDRRVRPARDDKILTDWNGLMIAALARGYRTLGDRRYLEAARSAARFFKDTMWRGDILLHRYHQGAAGAAGTLDDYACLMWGLMELYQAGFDIQHLREAERLADILEAQFSDGALGGFFQTPDDRDDLIDRVKSGRDSSTPSGNAVAARALLTLYQLTDRAEYRTRAERTVRAFVPLMEQYPNGHLRLASLIDAITSPLVQAAVVGDGVEAEELLRVVNAHYLPDAVVCYSHHADDPNLPLFKGRGPVDGRAAAYYCRDFVCQAPVTDPAALDSLLAKGRTASP